MSCPDYVFRLIDNPEFPHQNVKETICPDQELIYKRSVINPILYIFLLLILLNLLSKFDNILHFCQQLIMLSSLTLYHAQLINCIHCFTIASPLSIRSLTCSIKKWVQGCAGGWAPPTQAFFQAGWAHHGRAHPRATEKIVK